MRPVDLLFVATGGMIGALARVLFEEAFLPLGVGLGLFIANLSGALALASISVLSDRLTPSTRIFLGTGFCGSFTSVSGLNALVALKATDGSTLAWLYLILSVGFALPLVFWVLGWKTQTTITGGHAQ